MAISVIAYHQKNSSLGISFNLSSFKFKLTSNSASKLAVTTIHCWYLLRDESFPFFFSQQVG